MNTPTHIVGGACAAYALARAGLPHRMPLARSAIVAFGCLAAGVATHLILDLLPHYAWVVYLEWLKPMPFHWLIREGILGLALAVPALVLAGRWWPYVGLGMLGGIYPDVEKVLCVDFHLPDRFILFDWHSTYLSTRTGGLPRSVLVTMEAFLIAGFLLAMWKWKRRARQRLMGTHGSKESGRPIV